MGTSDGLQTSPTVAFVVVLLVVILVVVVAGGVVGWGGTCPTLPRKLDLDNCPTPEAQKWTDLNRRP